MVSAARTGSTRTALKRLAQSILRYLEPDSAQEVREEHGLEPPFEFLGAKTLGGSHLLDGVWRRLGIKDALSRLLKERGFSVPVERVLFALGGAASVGAGQQAGGRVVGGGRAHIDGLPAVESQQLYRAMDFLLEAHDEIQREVFWSVRNLFNLEVDVIFVDTTSTYFEIEGEDERRTTSEDGDGDGSSVAVATARTAGRTWRRR